MAAHDNETKQGICTYIQWTNKGDVSGRKNEDRNEPIKAHYRVIQVVILKQSSSRPDKDYQ